MADTKVSALTAAAVAALANELPVNEAGTSKKVTLAQVHTLLQTLGGTRVDTLATQHAISSATATVVPDLTMALEAGTYVFEYSLIVRSATSTVSPMYGVNFTGTATKKKIRLEYSDQSATLLAAIGTASAVGTTALGFHMSQSVTAFSTTTPNMGHVAGVGTINADILITVKGVIVVSVAGNLEFWHGSETATATSIEVGSSLVVHRTV